MKYFKWIVAFLFLFLSFIFLFVQNWVINNFGTIDMTQIIFLLIVPMKGVDSSIINEFINYCILLPLMMTGLVFSIFYFTNHIFFKKNMKKSQKVLKNSVLVISIVFLCVSFNFSGSKIGLFTYIENMKSGSTIFDDYYVNPNDVEIEFPENKRNLIHIFLESMETSYYSTELGGTMADNLIPELYELAESNLTFNNNSGFRPTKGTTWTVGAMVGQTSGLPLLIPIDGNSYGSFEKFLPGATTLGDILHNQGYNQKLMIGSEAEFGGRSDYFTQHGNYEIVDYASAIEKEYIPEDYHVWWGYEDIKLFEFAKDELLELANHGEPFNFTLLTADTHFFDGYFCDECEELYDNHYSNVISCSSRHVYAFVKWIQQQDFYENTTILISGDHLTMDDNYVDAKDENYIRNCYYVFINSPKDYQDQNRLITSFDLFPTMLTCLNVNFKGDRLGIGTDLFSNSKTIYEELGWDDLQSQLSKDSLYYNQHILFSDK